MATSDPRFLRSVSNLPQAKAGAVRRIANQFQGQIGVSISAALVNGLNEAVASRVPKIGQAVAASLQADILQADRRELNLGLALGAQEAVYDAYQSRTRFYTPGGVPDPRTEGRYGPGVLAGALGDPSMVAGTTRSRISFVNTDVLDQEASHWRRLNFGAGGNSSSGGVGEPQGAFPLDFFGPSGGRTRVGVLEFAPGVRPAMIIPAHYWDEEGFFHVGRKPDGVTGRSAGTMKVGARGAQFLDAGLRYIADNAGREYLVMFNNLLRDPATQKKIEARFGAPIRATNLRNLR